MQSEKSGRAASIVGFILLSLGVMSLAYFASPIRLLLSEANGQGTINVLPPILGALALCGGIVLLYIARPGTGKKKTEL